MSTRKSQKGRRAQTDPVKEFYAFKINFLTKSWLRFNIYMERQLFYHKQL